MYERSEKRCHSKVSACEMVNVRNGKRAKSYDKSLKRLISVDNILILHFDREQGTCSVHLKGVPLSKFLIVCVSHSLGERVVHGPLEVLSSI